MFAFARAPSQKPVSAQSARAYLRGMLRKAGIEKKWISPHELRHAYATHPLDAGAERVDIEALLGHESVATTPIYTNVGQERMETEPPSPVPGAPLARLHLGERAGSIRPDSPPRPGRPFWEAGPGMDRREAAGDMLKAQPERGVSRQPEPAPERHRRALGLCGLVGLLLSSLAAPGDDPPSPPTDGAPAAAKFPQRRYPLNDRARDLAQTEAGREFVRYLADCALGAGVVADADVAGRRHEFPGAMGLAPHWLHRPLTEAEQRWVSACILARTNAFGVEVKISLRADHGSFPALATTDEERREFTLHEGDFFGNLFADPPVAAVARGRATPEQRHDPVFQLRVCAAEDPDAAPLNGRKLSRCRFIITGDARDTDAHTLNGQAYAQYISVYLKPQAPSTRPARP